MSPRFRLIAVALTIAIGAAIGWVISDIVISRNDPAALIAAPIGGPFALTDQDGRPRTDADFRGQVLLLSFGYTNCPDVCPLTLGHFAEAIEQLGPDAARVRGVFITVDPQRDTPARLRDYVTAFGDRIVGLTGSREAIDRVARAYRVIYRLGADAATNPHYTVDHSALIYLIGRDGRYRAHFNHDVAPDVLATALRGALG